jgi:hypothetical protein
MPYTEHTVTRHEYVVAAPPPGAPAIEVAAAWSAAEVAYRTAANLAADEPTPDGALVFRPAPNAVVISFVVEQQPPS